MNTLPKIRTENLVEQSLGAETLIYDLTTHKAFNLNETLSVVYRACAANVSFDELKRHHKFTDDFIHLALDELKRNNLLAENYQSPFAQTNRRDVIKKVGLATMFALPLIAGLVAPQAVNAASGTVADPNVGTLYNACRDCNGGGCCGYGSDGYLLTCTNGRCCNQFARYDNNLPGAALPSKYCYTDFNQTYTCGELGFSQYCCSGSVSGTCTLGPGTFDENGDYALCTGDSYGAQGYNEAVCSCVCD